MTGVFYFIFIAASGDVVEASKDKEEQSPDTTDNESVLNEGGNEFAESGGAATKCIAWFVYCAKVSGSQKLDHRIILAVKLELMNNIDLGLRAKETLINFVQKIDRELSVFWDEEMENNCFGYSTGQAELSRQILEHLREHNLRTGKRLRASFVWFGYQLGRKKIDEIKLYKACMAVEMIHTALLIQDDFMDEDSLRRGRPTTHICFARGKDRHFGESMAVLASDVALTLGYQLLLNSGFEENLVRKALDCVLRGVINTGYGQAFDMEMGEVNEWDEEDVMALHKTKTAIYTYQNPLFVGGILGELSNDVMVLLSEYSMAAGVAFQLQDDVLGVWGDTEKTGKSSDSDLLQGKRTLLALKTLEMGNEEQKKCFLKVWGKKEAAEEDLDLAKKAIKDCGSYGYSVVLAKKLAEDSVDIVEKLRGFDLDEEAILYLQGIAQYMVDREV